MEKPGDLNVSAEPETETHTRALPEGGPACLAAEPHLHDQSTASPNEESANIFGLSELALELLHRASSEDNLTVGDCDTSPN